MEASAAPVAPSGEVRLSIDQADQGILELEKLGLNGTKVEGQDAQGRKVVWIKLDEESAKRLQQDPTLLEKLKKGWGLAAGIGFGFLIALANMATFAIPGGICLGLGNEWRDNPGATQGQRDAAPGLQKAGVIVLAVGGGLSGLIWGIAIAGGIVADCV